MQDRENTDVVSQAVKRAAQVVLETAREKGTKVAVMKDGKPTQVSPDDIQKLVKRIEHD